MPRLLVIVPDNLSDILTKGEFQPCYYNPGQVFDEVHILTTTDDRPDLVDLQRTVGRASLLVHSLPVDLSLPSWPTEFLRRWRLRRWARKGVELARRIRPDLIRCHGADWNTFLASRIKTELDIPYVVSLHINPDVNPVRRYLKPKTATESRHNAFYEHVESEGLRNADLVMPVYQPILPYLERLGVKKVEVCYNVLNRLHLKKKTDYGLHQPPRIIYVGRLFEDKNPDNIMRAVAKLPSVELTVVGDGPIRGKLEAFARTLGVADRVRFRPAIRNDELCATLPDHDIFAVHTEYWEISKSVLEALLTGLPLVINRRHGPAVPELEGDFVVKVENSEDGYYKALHRLLTNDADRSALGRRAYAHAQANWAPAITEARYASIYRGFLGQTG
jgi:glycosyltransferase involved in cell wall biosynthesis